MTALKRSPSAPLILRHIAKNEGVSSVEIAQALGMSPDTVRWNVARLLRHHEIRVSDWTPRPHVGGRGRALYAIGPGLSVPYPAKTRNEILSAHRERGKLKKRLDRGVNSGPFRVLVAQVTV